MSRNEKLVKLSDIKCEQIVEKIKECTTIISKFANVLNKHLEYKELKQPQIFIVRSDETSYEDDGNTRTPGYNYEVYWCFPYVKVDEEVAISRIVHYESFMWPRCLLFFRLSISERIKDHKYKGGHFFKLYLTEESEENGLSRVACYNDNYKLNSMLNVQNIYTCIKGINEVYNRISIKQTLLEELSEVDEVTDIEEFINQNCKGV